ncbi:hypothetical protein [Sorangium sp. So ce145]|uniref:hypothetical protein n=1 Tax=Sorangium sp. So ce145 TaxID=3133285 RepID=UPI003F5E7170
MLDLDAAIADYDAALALHQAKRHRLKALVLTNRGELRAQRGDIVSAASDDEAALELAKANSNGSLQARILLLRSDLRVEESRRALSGLFELVMNGKLAQERHTAYFHATSIQGSP